MVSARHPPAKAAPPQVRLSHGHRPAQRHSIQALSTNHICTGKRNDPPGAADQVAELFQFWESLRVLLVGLDGWVEILEVGTTLGRTGLG